MTGIRSGVLLLAALGMGGSAQAGGFAPVADVVPVAPPPAVVPPPAALPISGAVWLDYGRMTYSNDDEVEDETADSLGFGGAVEANLGRFILGFDAQSLSRDLPDPEEDTLYAPDILRAYGLHLGTEFGALRVGAFYGMNRFTGYNDEGTSDYEVDDGTVKGLEAEYAIGDRFAVFAQAGRADLESTEDDVEFHGDFLRVGASGTFGRFGGAIDFERGSTDDYFPDEGDSGEYRGLGLRADYMVTDNLSINASWNRLEVETDPVDEGDNGEETTISIGATYAFGGRSTRPNLVTPWRPGLVTSWGEALD